MKRSWWSFIGIIGLIVVAYLFTRLSSILSIPIFTDEAIYIRWAQIGSLDPQWRFISLTDGKQPLFIWLMMMSLRIFTDPLLAGRLVSVGAGLCTLLGLGVLSMELFGQRRIALMVMLLYVLYPFALVYDRLAIYDSLVGALSIWNLWLLIKVSKTLQLDFGLLSGMLLGLGMINKTSGFISAFLYPLGLLFLPKWNTRAVIRWVGFFLIVIVLSQVIYGVLRLSPFFYLIAQKDTVFVHPFSDFLTVYKFFQGNVRGLFDWLVHYMTIPIFLLGLSALFIDQKFLREKILLYVWWLIPLIGLAYFGKVLYPRFIFFMTLPLLVISAYALVSLLAFIPKKTFKVVVFVIVIFRMAMISTLLLVSPVDAPIPFADRGQLLTDWPSGWGIKEVNTFLDKESRDTPVTIFTDGTFGLLPYAIEIYHWNNENITIKGVYPIPEDFPEEITRAAQHSDTYIVFNQNGPPSSWPVMLIAEYQKGNNSTSSLRLYKVIASFAAL